MGATSAYHRPLVSGIRVVNVKRDENEGILSSGVGTLTGLATRNSDGRKVLVTNLHVITGRIQRNPSGGEEMYQELVNATKKVGTVPAWNADNPAWVPIVNGQDNIADVAICELDEGVDAEFILHDDPNHSSRTIIAGVKEPTVGMTLTMMGASGGEGTVTVKEVNETEDVDERKFTGLTILDCIWRPVQNGDSGSACLYKVKDGQYRMSCIVFSSDSDEREGWAFPASVAEKKLGITFGNRAPTADAGSDRTVDTDATVTLRGSGTDPDEDALTYSWEQTAGTTVTLSSMSISGPTFTAPSSPATLAFKLTVTDSLGQTATDTVTFTVIQTTAEEAVRKYDANSNGLIEPSEVLKAVRDYFDGKISPKEVKAVVAKYHESVPPDAPEDLSATSGNAQITLGWSNPDNASITRYEYRLKSGANAWGSWTAIPGSGPATVTHAITGLTNSTAYTVQVRAVNARGNGQSAQVGPVTPSASNRRPTARAGSDRTVNVGASVTLSGSGTDPDGDSLSYSWAQMPGGAGVDIQNSTSASASFTAPSTARTLKFRLTVNDGRGGTDIDDVTITVVQPNRAPTANAGANQSVSAGASVTLSGSGTDPDGDTLSYAWTQDFGSARAAIASRDGVTLKGANTRTATFTAPAHATTLTFRLTVSDGKLSDTDDVAVTVTRRPTPPPPPTETWGSWSDTGSTQGCGPTKQKEQSRTSNLGNTQTKWVSDSESLRWGSWTDTGRTRGSGAERIKQQSRASHCGDTQTRWVGDSDLH